MRREAQSAVRNQVMLWGAQRVTAAILALCVIVHLITIIYAVRNGLTAAEILARTHGSVVWGSFYALFVIAVAVHAPIGLRNILAEFGKRGPAVDTPLIFLAMMLAMWGLRAVWAVVS